MSSPRRIGVLLAAGRGRRMGGTKQLVMWETPTGSKPLVAAAYDAIRPICADMIVVVGHEADAVNAALGDRPFQCIRSDPDAPMFESIRAGILAALQFDSDATVVIQPGDHPDVAETTLEHLANLSEQQQEKAILPEFGGRGGHPVFVPPFVARRVLDAECVEGLGRFWASHPELRVRVPVVDATIVRDLDRPADLLD